MQVGYVPHPLAYTALYIILVAPVRQVNTIYYYYYVCMLYIEYNVIRIPPTHYAHKLHTV